MKPYQPSNNVPSAGLTWMLLSSILGGIAIGSITHFISLLVYLIVLFPLGMGFAGGAVTGFGVQQGKVRNPMIAALFGILTGLTLYGTMHTAAYLQFRQEASQEIKKELGQTNQAQTDQLIDGFLQQSTGSTGLVGFVKYNAQQGVSIGRVGSKGANLGETGTWIYWLIELGVITAMTGAIAYGTAKFPFCENCNQWYKSRERLGSVKDQDSEQFLSLIREEQFSKAGQLIDPLTGSHAPSLEVHLQQCASCQMSELMLSASLMSLDSKGNLSAQEQAQGMISLSQYNKLQAAMNATLSQDEKNSGVTEEQIRLAQQERSQVVADDRLEPHRLSAAQSADLVQQLSRYPQVKEAYLVRKAVQYFPEKPFYVLGIVRKPGLIESKDAERKLLDQLMKELKLTGQTWIVGLNKDKPMTRALQKVGEPLYRRSK